MLRAQAFSVVIDRMRPVRRHFVELSAEFEFAPAIIGMRYERACRGQSGNLVNISLARGRVCAAALLHRVSTAGALKLDALKFAALGRF